MLNKTIPCLRPESKFRILTIILFIAFTVIINTGHAQDLVLEKLTISTTETYEATNSITAGPDFTITNTGIVTFRAGNVISLKPGFVVEGGGQFYALTNVSVEQISGDLQEIPIDFALEQNYPNPFNPSTTIEFRIPTASAVSLKIYNSLGEVLATLIADRLNPGSYTFHWHAPDLASGVYLYRLQAEGFVETRKMILLR